MNDSILSQKAAKDLPFSMFNDDSIISFGWCYNDPVLNMIREIYELYAQNYFTIKEIDWRKIYNDTPSDSSDPLLSNVAKFGANEITQTHELNSDKLW